MSTWLQITFVVCGFLVLLLHDWAMRELKRRHDTLQGQFLDNLDTQQKLLNIVAQIAREQDVHRDAILEKGRKK